MSVLQLRRFLRAIGQSTVGLKSVLTSRVEKAVSSGAVQAYVDKTKGKPQGAVECGKYMYFVSAEYYCINSIQGCLRVVTVQGGGHWMPYSKTENRIGGVNLENKKSAGPFFWMFLPG